MQANISENAMKVLKAVGAGAADRKAVASRLRSTVPTINGSLTQLRRNGLVAIDDDSGEISLTRDGKGWIRRGGPSVKDMKTGMNEEAGRVKTVGTKIEAARKVFVKLAEKGRAVVLEHFRQDIGLTRAGASTYYQTLRHEPGLMQAAFQKKRPTAKKASTMRRRTKQ